MTSKKRSRAQEKSVALQFSAKTTAASGALWGMKGDVRNGDFLIECKTTGKDRYFVTSRVWEKIRREALKDGGRIPVLIVDLKDRFRYAVFDPSDFGYIPASSAPVKSFSLSLSTPYLHFTLEPVTMNMPRHDVAAVSFDVFQDYVLKGEEYVL